MTSSMPSNSLPINTNSLYFYWPEESLGELATLHNFLQQGEQCQLAMMRDAITREYRARDHMCAVIGLKGQTTGTTQQQERKGKDNDPDVEVIGMTYNSQRMVKTQPKMAQSSSSWTTADQGTMWTMPSGGSSSSFSDNNFAHWRRAFETALDTSFGCMQRRSRPLNKRLLQFRISLLKQQDDGMQDLQDLQQKNDEFSMRELRQRFALSKDREGREVLVRRRGGTQQFVAREEWFEVLLGLHKEMGSEVNSAEFCRMVRKRFANLSRSVVRLFLRTQKENENGGGGGGGRGH